MAAKANASLANGGRHLKCVVVGDGTVGKTCLLISYCANRFQEDYIPTVFDHYSMSLIMDNALIFLGIWDTAGQEDYSRLRPLAYPGTDVFIICYSIDNPVSYENVIKTWLPEIKHHQPKTPCILVATKADLRASESTATDWVKLITTSQGLKLQKDIGADRYIECSAKLQINVMQVFEAAIRVAIRPVTPPKPGRRCILL